MAQVIVRNLENSVKDKLRRRAKRHGHSMEQEVRDILCSAVSQETQSESGLGTELAQLFSEVGIRSEMPELRGQTLKPARFKK